MKAGRKGKCVSDGSEGVVVGVEVVEMLVLNVFSPAGAY